jgi:hypothetical protein
MGKEFDKYLWFSLYQYAVEGNFISIAIFHTTVNAGE